LDGCCGGRETTGFFAVRLHNAAGARSRRLPVQYLEMAWWALGAAIFYWCWPLKATPGSYALGVVAWYGTGRAVLEPMRERSDMFGRIRVNQLVAVLRLSVREARSSCFARRDESMPDPRPRRSCASTWRHGTRSRRGCTSNVMHAVDVLAATWRPREAVYGRSGPLVARQGAFMASALGSPLAARRRESSTGVALRASSPTSRPDWPR
jgi:hypothetical protein